MKTNHIRNFLRTALALAAGALLLGATAEADVVETNSGSIIKGTLVSSDAGVVKFKTDFAGVIEIKLAEVRTITTDNPVFVQLDDGNAVQGRIEQAGDGLRVAGSTGAIQTRTSSIAHIWQPGDKSPAERMVKKWVYEAAIDINGKQGNSDRSFVGLSGRATLQGEADRLFFYGSFAQADDNGDTSQDEGKAGGDYTTFLNERTSWYVRTELGFDRTKDLDLRSQSGVGLGYTAIKNSVQSLELRYGLGYRFENYGVGEDFDSIGLDLGLLHSYIFPWGKMTNSLTLTPAFSKFSNFVLTHESAFELPLKASDAWKLRLGLRNDYTSEPPNGLKKHDMSYFAQFVFAWK